MKKKEKKNRIKNIAILAIYDSGEVRQAVPLGLYEKLLIFYVYSAMCDNHDAFKFSEPIKNLEVSEK